MILSSSMYENKYLYGFPEGVLGSFKCLASSGIQKVSEELDLLKALHQERKRRKERISKACMGIVFIDIW